MAITFHQIESKDRVQVLMLFRKAAEKIDQMNIDHWQYWKNPPLEKINWMDDGIKNKEFFFIANENEEKIGMVRILNQDIIYWGNTNDKAIYIHSLVILEEYNGQGYGSKVINQIEKKAIKNQCQFLRLDAVTSNTKLCKYYENLGFEKIGTKQMTSSLNSLYEKAL